MRYLTVILLLSVSCNVIGTTVFNPVESIYIQTTNGPKVQLESDDPVGLITRPLRELKQRLDKRYHSDFLQFRKITVEPGRVITGTFTVKDIPLRLTVYQISRKSRADNFYLRVVCTGFYQVDEVSTIETAIEDLKNNVFIITAEKVDN